jgi:HEAT repeats
VSLFAETIVDYRKFLPHPPSECRDPELFRLLNEFRFVRWHPDYEKRCDEIHKQITTQHMLLRAELAVEDPYERLRQYAGELLIWVRREDTAPFIQTLLHDENEFVRGETARTLSQVRCDSCVARLIELATLDCSPFVRGCAASGLGGQNPKKSIPVLIEILDNDHAACETGHTPSGRAATALDEIMETEWTQKRFDSGLRGLNPDGTDLAALREQSLLFLRHCQERKDGK